MKRFDTSDGLSLAYRDEGDGVPVLCLAGLTRNGTDFDDMMGHMPSGFRVLRLDYRGRGQSDHDPDYLNYHLPIEARDAVELLDHLGIARAAIIGTSRGGLIAMILAAMAKDRLLGALLNDIGPEIAPVGLERIMDYLGRTPQLASYDDAAAALGAFHAATFPSVAPAQWRRAATRWFDEGPDGLVLNYDAKLRDAVLAHSADPAPDAWPLFDAFEGLPLALVRGANTDLLTMETVEKMQARHPSMLFANVPDRAHVPFLDEPEAVEVLHQFLGQLNESLDP